MPVRARLRATDSLARLLADLQEGQARLLPHQHLGLAEILRTAGGGDLFDTLLVFENYPMEPEDLAAAGSGLRVGGIETRDATHYPLSLMAQPGERLLLRLDYDPTRVAPATAEARGTDWSACWDRPSRIPTNRCTGWTGWGTRSGTRSGRVQRHQPAGPRGQPAGTLRGPGPPLTPRPRRWSSIRRPSAMPS